MKREQKNLRSTQKKRRHYHSFICMHINLKCLVYHFKAINIYKAATDHPKISLNPFTRKSRVYSKTEGLENKVCKLNKSLYGLKQASRRWNGKFKEEIKKSCFKNDKLDDCLLTKESGNSCIVTTLYVDDI